MRWPLFTLMLVLAGCGGGSSPSAPPPAPPIPPPIPPVPTTCQLTVAWTNPTEDMNGNTLAPDALIQATAWFFRVPEVPRDVDMIHDVAAYGMTFTYIGPAENTGVLYYVYMTVTSEAGTSNPSNTIEKECK